MEKTCPECNSTELVKENEFYRCASCDSLIEIEQTPIEKLAEMCCYSKDECKFYRHQKTPEREFCLHKEAHSKYCYQPCQITEYLKQFSVNDIKKVLLDMGAANLCPDINLNEVDDTTLQDEEQRVLDARK